MRTIFITSAILFAFSLSGCAAVSVAGTVVSTAVSVTGTVISTTASVAGTVVSTTAEVVGAGVKKVAGAGDGDDVAKK